MFKIAVRDGCHVFAVEDAYFKFLVFPRYGTLDYGLYAGFLEVFKLLKYDLFCSNVARNGIVIAFVGNEL